MSDPRIFGALALSGFLLSTGVYATPACTLIETRNYLSTEGGTSGTMQPRQCFVSENGRFWLHMNDEGDVIIYDDWIGAVDVRIPGIGRVSGGHILWLQPFDGNLAHYAHALDVKNVVYSNNTSYRAGIWHLSFLQDNLWICQGRSPLQRPSDAVCFPVWGCNFEVVGDQGQYCMKR